MLACLQAHTGTHACLPSYNKPNQKPGAPASCTDLALLTLDSMYESLQLGPLWTCCLDTLWTCWAWTLFGYVGPGHSLDMLGLDTLWICWAWTLFEYVGPGHSLDMLGLTSKPWPPPRLLLHCSACSLVPAK